MSRLFTTVSAITLLTGSAALADSPRVVADIAPVHSLVQGLWMELVSQILLFQTKLHLTIID